MQKPLIPFLSTLFLLSCSHSPQDNTVRIGTLFHLTGEFAVQGEAFKEGAELAADAINKHGGINGRKLVLIHEDTQYRPLQAVSGAQKLLGRDHVSAVLVSTATEVKAVAPLLRQAKVPGITLWDSSPEIETLGEYLFGLGPWTPSSGEESARFAFDNLKARRAAVIASNTEWSLSVAQFFAEKFKALGGTIVYEAKLNPSETDYRTPLLKLKDAKPDVVYAPVDSNIPQFFSQTKHQKLTIPIITSDVITDDLLITENSGFEGAYQTMTADPHFPATERMKTEYEAFFKKPLTQTSYVAWGYDGVMLIAKALEDPTGKDLYRTLLAIQKFPGASGEISFSAQGSAPRPVTVFMVQGGALQSVNISAL